MDHDAQYSPDDGGAPAPARRMARGCAFGACGFAISLAAAAILLAPIAARHARADASRCGSPGMDPSRISALAPRALRVPSGRILLRVADTPGDRQRGLMCVASVPHGYGMAFAFPPSAGDRRRFWMKNTLIPLDMVFVARDGTVTGIAADVRPPQAGTPDEALPMVDGTGGYVLELPTGDARAFGIAAGTRLDVSDLARRPR